MEDSKVLKSLEEARLAGDKFYFTGKPCKNGHVTERYVAIRVCVACHAEAALRWKADNPEKRRKILNGWKKRNKDKHESYVKKAKAKKPEQYNAYSKAWVQRNPEKRKQVSAEYAKRNPEKVLANTNARRARLMKACPAWADLKAIQKIYEERRKISLDTGIAHHVDHIIPLRGKNVCGLHVPWNLRVIPASENFRKGAKVDDRFLEELYGTS